MNTSPDGWAHKGDEPEDPDTVLPSGPFSITSMPVQPPQYRPPDMGKLGRTVAGPTRDDS